MRESNSMRPRPYIGVTGARFAAEVVRTAETFETLHRTFRPLDLPDFIDHVPMMGILVSSGTLRGEPTQNRRYPDIEYVPSLLSHSGNSAFATVHYTTTEQNTLFQQLQHIFSDINPEYFPHGLGVQLNIAWPRPDQVRRIKDEFPYLSIIFQANAKVLGSGTPNQVAERIANEYGRHIEHVFIDPSAGKGEGFNVGQSLEMYALLELHLPDAMIGFAGGLSADNVKERIRDIRESLGTAAFSIDAEGQLRDKLSEFYGDDLFNQGKADEYINEAYFAFMK